MVILTHPCTSKMTWMRIIISRIQKYPFRKNFDEITIIPAFLSSFPLLYCLQPYTFRYKTLEHAFELEHVFNSRILINYYLGTFCLFLQQYLLLFQHMKITKSMHAFYVSMSTWQNICIFLKNCIYFHHQFNYKIFLNHVIHIKSSSGNRKLHLPHF